MKKKAIDKHIDNRNQLDDEALKAKRRKRRKKIIRIVLCVLFIPLLFFGGLSCFLGKDEK